MAETPNFNLNNISQPQQQIGSITNNNFARQQLAYNQSTTNFQNLQTGYSLHNRNLSTVGISNQVISQPLNSLAIKQPFMSNPVSYTPTTMTHQPVKTEFVAPPSAPSTPNLNANVGTSGNYGTNITPDMAKKKCKNFLATLLKLSYHQPAQVSQSVKNLIQGLVDNNVTAEEFTQRLQNELKSSPQPCLIPFLKKSLPYLQISLCQGESVIEGIKPPFLQALLLKQNNIEQMQALISAINTVFNTNSINPTASAAMLNAGNVPLLANNMNSNLIASLIQQHQLQQQQQNAVSHLTNTVNIANQQLITGPTGILLPNMGVVNRSALTTPLNASSTNSLLQTLNSNNNNNTILQAQNQLLASNNSSFTLNPMQSIQLANLQQRLASATNLNVINPQQNVNIINNSSNNYNNLVAMQPTIPLKPIQLPPHMSIKPGGSTNALSTHSPNKSASGTSLLKNIMPKKALPGGVEQPTSPIRDEDDINDVTAMGGVNINEEKQKILAGTNELVGYQIRSCPDESIFLNSLVITQKLDPQIKENELMGYDPEIIKLISHAIESRIRTMVAKLCVIAEHRMDTYKTDPKYEIESDVKAQFKFLEEIDSFEKKRKEEQDKEMLFKIAKRSKLEDPEQLKIKQKVKEMQIAQLEEARQMEANLTALAAIGPRKKKLGQGPGNENQLNSNDLGQQTSNNFQDGISKPNLTSLLPSQPNFGSASNLTAIRNYAASTLDQSGLRNRIKRITVKDFIFMLEQDKDYCRSAFLYELYLKAK